MNFKMRVEWSTVEITSAVRPELESSLDFVLFTLRNSSNSSDGDLLIGQKLRFTIVNLRSLERDIAVIQTSNMNF